MSLELITKVVIFVSAFCIGATFVYRRSQRGGRPMPPARAPASGATRARRHAPAAAEGLDLVGLLKKIVGTIAARGRDVAPAPLARDVAAQLAAPRPGAQMPVRSFEAVVEDTATERLIESIERRTRLTHNNFERDCVPVLRALAEFVQFLPASECHHHAQPGGLWIHALEVVDAALTFRAGLELPLGASTEERKRQEHRWTYAVFVAALLHDVGKPVTEVRVTLYGPDPRSGQPWAPMAGPMRAFAAHYYSVAFIDSDARDYVAHSKLAAMLLHKFVPERVMRWLGEDAALLTQLVAYLSGDDPAGDLGSIVKRADSDSVRRNLLQGPRTRFATARTVPLIERLMQALRRMLAEGALPLNRPGAAGWVHDGKVWFVCARLADEVRSYLAQHESAQGIPGKERNDRLFDTWQEFGAALPASDGGAVWRAHVQCENWAPPEPFTLLCFRLQALFPDASRFPEAMRGHVTPVDAPRAARPPAAAGGPSHPARPASAGSTPQRIEPWLDAADAPGAANGPSAAAAAAVPPQPPSAPKLLPAPPASQERSLVTQLAPVPAPEPAPRSASDVAAQGTALPQLPPLRQEALPPHAPRWLPGRDSDDQPGSTPQPQPKTETPVNPSASNTEALGVAASGRPDAERSRATDTTDTDGPEDSDTLGTADQALAEFHRAQHSDTPQLGEPIQPRQRGLRPGQAGAAPAVAAAAKPAPAALGSAAAAQAGTRPGGRGPTPAAAAFMAWVAQAVGTGELAYNEDGALVHFAPEGALLLSPEIFRRFFNAHAAVPDGPIAALRQSHGERAFARLQNELAKSGWTARNGDENLHYYAFLKADGTPSRTASFYLIPQPALFWSPVPGPNARIRLANRPKKMKLPDVGAAAASGDDRAAKRAHSTQGAHGAPGAAAAPEARA